MSQNYTHLRLVSIKLSLHFLSDRFELMTFEQKTTSAYKLTTVFCFAPSKAPCYTVDWLNMSISCRNRHSEDVRRSSICILSVKQYNPIRLNGCPTSHTDHRWNGFVHIQEKQKNNYSTIATTKKINVECGNGSFCLLNSVFLSQERKPQGIIVEGAKQEERIMMRLINHLEALSQWEWWGMKIERIHPTYHCVVIWLRVQSYCMCALFSVS